MRRTANQEQQNPGQLVELVPLSWSRHCSDGFAQFEMRAHYGEHGRSGRYYGEIAPDCGTFTLSMRQHAIISLLT
jgi:hypothetical protein